MAGGLGQTGAKGGTRVATLPMRSISSCGYFVMETFFLVLLYKIFLFPDAAAKLLSFLVLVLFFF